MSSSRVNQLLEDEPEINDFTFLNHPKQERDGYMLHTANRENGDERQSNWESKQIQVLQECRRIEERTLQSSCKSLGMLHESEQVGIMTAEELVHQREQLQNVEQNLDKMNSTMRISQKHINSIKSMFSGLKNYFSQSNTSDSAALTSTQAPTSKPVTSNLQGTVENLRAAEKSTEGSHPALRIRGIDTPDFQAAHASDDFDQPHLKSRSSRGMGVSQTVPSSYSQNIDEQLDKNLEFMSLGLGRLKSLAIGLNEEIETQNDMLDRINVKVDRADGTLEHQNRQIKHILKK